MGWRERDGPGRWLVVWIEARASGAEALEANAGLGQGLLLYNKPGQSDRLPLQAVRPARVELIP